LNGYSDGAHYLPRYITIDRIAFIKGSVQIHHMQHPRALSLEFARDSDRVVSVDFHVCAPPLRETHTLALSQIDGGNN
jgi:hypothetical protein